MSKLIQSIEGNEQEIKQDETMQADEIEVGYIEAAEPEDVDADQKRTGEELEAEDEWELDEDDDTEDQAKDDATPTSDQWHRVQELTDEVRRLADLHETAKKKASKLKKDLESATEELVNEIEEIRSGQRRFNFGAYSGDQTKTAEKELDATPTPDTVSDPEAWRAVKIGDAIRLTPKVAESIEAEGAVTMGDFVDLDASGKLATLPGVGPKRYDDLKDQMVEWLARNQSGEPDNGTSLIDDPEDIDDPPELNEIPAFPETPEGVEE